MNNSIFQVGDVVYHPALGRGVVEEDRLQFDNGMHSEINFSEYPKILSFSPWPEPNHVRPLKDGVYKVIYSGNPSVLARKDGSWFFINSTYHHESPAMRREAVEYQSEVQNVEFLYSCA